MENLRFGKLLVIERAGSNKRKERLWKCLCDCGKETIVKSRNLNIGKTRSCGCLKTGPDAVDVIGQVFNRLTVVKYVGRTKCRNQRLECLCECGNTIIANLNTLRSETTKSCGCYKVDLMKSRCGENSASFDPNRSQEDRERGRNIPGYAEWCFKVKERDAFTCWVCRLSKSGKMVSHHLDAYHWCKELRCDIDNGVCLCENCHKGFHLKYGTKDNKRWQFEEYLNHIIYNK